MPELVVPSLPDLSDLDPLQALAAGARLRVQLLTLEVDTIWRARLAGHSWRAIAAAAGVNGSTLRRWAVRGVPDAPRYRVGSQGWLSL